jgi:hypothetical protein
MLLLDLLNSLRHNCLQNALLDVDRTAHDDFLMRKECLYYRQNTLTALIF